MPSEVRRGTVRIEMCEAHRARPRPAGYVTYGAQRCLLHFFLEIQITVPRDATFHCVAHHAARNRMFAQIGATQEFVTPITGSAMALGIFKSKRTAIPCPAVVAADLECSVHPGFERVVCRFKGQYQDIVSTLAGFREVSLTTLDQPAIGWIQSCLTDRAYGGSRFFVVVEANGCGQAVDRTAVQPHPSLCDDAECTLRAEK